MSERAPVRGITEALSAAAEAVCLRDLGDEALSSMQRALGASSALLYRYGEGGALEAIAGNLVGAMATYTAELVADDPLQHAPRRMEPGVKVVLVTRAVDRREYRASAAYNEFYRRCDLEHVACTWITDGVRYGVPGMTGILLGRSAKQPEFSARDVRLLELALPAFAAATRRSARLEAAEGARHALEALFSRSGPRPMLALDGRGRLLWASEAAERLLERSFGGRRALPDAIVAAARAIGAAERGEEPESPPAFRVSVALPTGRPLGAELSLARSETGEPIVTVELDPPSERSSFEAFAARHRLTRAESDVLRILGGGLSNAEIAGRLHVSVETVRTHVARILAKLEVPTRVQAALLVRDLASS